MGPPRKSLRDICEEVTGQEVGMCNTRGGTGNVYTLHLPLQKSE